MSAVTIKVRDNGPFLVEGPVTIVDAVGNRFVVAPEKPAVALCRCGTSKNKPFCDGSHKTCSFIAAERAPVAAVTSPAVNPPAGGAPLSGPPLPPAG
jgi:CDGSH-type Zn-finger protein